MSDVFISYDSSDREKAKTLAKTLEQRGWSVWWDKKIPPGKTFDEVIAAALDAAKCVVVLWSKESVKSHWVKDEASAGRQREILVPVLIDDVRIPLGFGQIQAARLIGWQGKVTDDEVDQLIESIASFVGHDKVEEQEPVTKPLVDKREEIKDGHVVTDMQADKGNTEKRMRAEETKDGIAGPKTKIRSQPLENLTNDAVETMIKNRGFFDSSWNTPASGFPNDYEVQNNGKVIYDRASGLMWQQSGSDNCMTYKNAKKYVVKLNRSKFAGFSDWRLPTLEEAMSLMEPKKKKGDLYIDPVFDENQLWIWTSDLYSASRAWVVHFSTGYCFNYDLSDFSGIVRAVR